MSKLDDYPIAAHRLDAILTSCLPGLLAAALSSAIWQRAAVVAQEVHQVVDLRRCCERTRSKLKNPSTLRPAHGRRASGGYGADGRSRTSLTAKVFHKKVVKQPAPPPYVLVAIALYLVRGSGSRGAARAHATAPHSPSVPAYLSHTQLLLMDNKLGPYELFDYSCEIEPYVGGIALTWMHRTIFTRVLHERQQLVSEPIHC